jgi:acetolactate synthase-1/2/3 large subunit
LYGEPVIRDWYEAATPKGGSLPDRFMRAYLRHHARRLFADAEGVSAEFVATVAAVAPPQGAVDQAAARLAGAERPLLVVGSQALVSAGQAEAVAEAISSLNIPVYLSGMARGLLGAAHPLHRRHQRRKALKEADVVILAGVPSDFRLDYGRHVRRSACLVSANRSKVDLKRNRKPDVGILADAGLFLRALADTVVAGTRERWRDWHVVLESRDAEREAEIDATAGRDSKFVNPVSLCRRIDAELPDESIIVADGGDFVGTASYIVKPRGPLSWLDPGVFGTLGCGAGFALGASLCRPGSEVWMLFGDGSVGYSLAEFDTFARHGIPVIAVVGNDAGWTQIAREQVKILRDDIGTVLKRSNYHEVADALGGHGILLQTSDQVVPGLREARGAASGGRPVLVNAWLDKTDFREGSLSM